MSLIKFRGSEKGKSWSFFFLPKGYSRPAAFDGVGGEREKRDEKCWTSGNNLSRTAGKAAGTTKDPGAWTAHLPQRARAPEPAGTAPETSSRRQERSPLLFALCQAGLQAQFPGWHGDADGSKMMGLCILLCTAHQFAGLQSILQTQLAFQGSFPLLPLQEGWERSLTVTNFLPEI